MLTKLLLVFNVCFPVFAIIAVGYFLKSKNFMPADGQKFINWLVYWICVPALIFKGISSRDFSVLLNPAVIFPTLIATFLMIVAYWFLGKSLKIRTTLMAPFLFGPIWGNVANLGIPLAYSAYGDEGVVVAAIINAFTLPVFILFGVFVLNYYNNDESDGSSGKRTVVDEIKRVAKNPIVLAAVMGTVVSGLRAAMPALDTLFPEFMVKGVVEILTQLGAAGLPLALIAIGGTLTFDALKESRTLLSMVAVGKLLIFPFVTFVVSKYLFAEAASAMIGTSVILMAAPAAMASFVVTTELSKEHEFVASHLVLTSVLSLVTIPIWVAVVI